jgi:hypothetical protein
VKHAQKTLTNSLRALEIAQNQHATLVIQAQQMVLALPANWATSSQTEVGMNVQGAQRVNGQIKKRALSQVSVSVPVVLGLLLRTTRSLSQLHSMKPVAGSMAPWNRLPKMDCL